MEDSTTAKSNDNNIAARIDELEAELTERKRALPAHSIRPHQLLRIEALEEELEELKRRLG